MYCTGTEQLFTDIINQTIWENAITLFETENGTFEFKSYEKKMMKINKITGESWLFNPANDIWEFMKTERPPHRSPYFPKR